MAIGLVFLAIYLVIAHPNFKFIDGIAHFLMPVADGIGDFITWPVRASGRLVKNIHNISNLERENEELRAQLDAALSDKNTCDVAIKENQKLKRELDIVNDTNFSTVVADVIYDNSVLNNGTFMINRGRTSGIERGMVVVSFDNVMVGIVIDSGSDFARVRGLTDSETNIAVRVAGSDVYGFLSGNGSNTPTIGFFNDHKFQVSPGITLITSGISGVLPSDIMVGKIKTGIDVDVVRPGDVSRVMVLRFNSDGKYK